MSYTTFYNFTTGDIVTKTKHGFYVEEMDEEAMYDYPNLIERYCERYNENI